MKDLIKNNWLSPLLVRKQNKREKKKMTILWLRMMRTTNVSLTMLTQIKYFSLSNQSSHPLNSKRNKQTSKQNPKLQLSKLQMIKASRRRRIVAVVMMKLTFVTLSRPPPNFNLSSVNSSGKNWNKMGLRSFKTSFLTMACHSQIFPQKLTKKKSKKRSRTMRRRVLSNNIFYHKLMISVKIKKRWLMKQQRNRDKKISRIKIANKTEKMKRKRRMRTLNLRTKTTSRLLQTKNY